MIWLEENGRAREADFLKDEGTTGTVVNKTPDEPDFKEVAIEDLPSGTKELEEMYKAKYTIGEGVGEVGWSDGDEEEVRARADEEETKDAENEEQKDEGVTYDIDEGAELETEGVVDCKDKDLLDWVLEFSDCYN
jgi:hypothetical protein